MSLKVIEVVAAIIERNGRILLAQRPPQADQPGLWEFPGGKVEAGETQPQALARELHEELGIVARPDGYIASCAREVSGRVIRLHAWRVRDFDNTPVNREHSALVWCTPQEAQRYPLAPADIPLLQAFMLLPDATPED